MRRELGELLASTHAGELDPSDFAGRLEALYARFLGEDANTPEMTKRRHDAVTAYSDLVAGKDRDRHHHLERLAQALSPDLPMSPPDG
jgi:hypothetical protein